METIKRIDENHIEIDGCIYEKKETKQEEKLPTTWEEFCQNYPIKEGESGINSVSGIYILGKSSRNSVSDKNILPNEDCAAAILALCQLIQLRDCYNQGWKPDWTKNDEKYCIEIYKNKIIKECLCHINTVLAFKTEELRNQFYNNFKDLIEVAKQLL